MDYIIARLKEPSTYAGLAALLASFHIVFPGWVAESLAILGPAVGGVLAIVLAERARPAVG